jgi:hypothetical protein
VKLLRIQDNNYLFELGKREKELLTLVLRLYPVIPSAHQPVSKSLAPGDNPGQHLLDEALAEQRKENKKNVENLLGDTGHFSETKGSCQMKLAPEEIEWLLQVLNDVRVGNWILLGSPDEEVWHSEPNSQNVPYVWAMEVAGLFQMNLLEAVSTSK